MNKRGQVYLVAGIMVCMLAFLLVSKPNFIREQVLLQNFETISNNYLTESPKVVNTALKESGTQDTPEEKLEAIKSDLSRFTEDFVRDYARNQDPNIGLIYIYNDENGIVIENYLNGENAYFIGQSGTSNVVLNYEESATSNFVFVGTGAGSSIEQPLCNNEILKDYCILEKGKVTPGEYILKFGDISYKFTINQESPELIIIIKSKEGETIKVDVSESKL